MQNERRGLSRKFKGADAPEIAVFPRVTKTSSERCKVQRISENEGTGRDQGLSRTDHACSPREIQAGKSPAKLLTNLLRAVEL